LGALTSLEQDMIKCGSGISKPGRHVSLAEEYHRMTSTYYNGELL